jgi:hypothetical protein
MGPWLASQLHDLVRQDIRITTSHAWNDGTGELLERSHASRASVLGLSSSRQTSEVMHP